jgi:signal recognition particle receptor subunit beta
MPARDPSGGVVEARIVYWGVEGAGKSQSLRTIHAKLRADNRGELARVPTRLDPTVCYETLPIELGEVRGVKTRLQVVTVPGAPEQAPTRKQLLDQVDGIVFVVDARPARMQDNLESFRELKQALAAYGRRIESVPLVVQYNKPDLGDPYGLEDFYRRLEVPGAAVFETLATDGPGVLRTLTTISKRVVRTLREPGPGAERPAAPATPEPPTEPDESVTRVDLEAPDLEAPAAPPRPTAPPPRAEPSPPAEPPPPQQPLEEAILHAGEDADGARADEDAVLGARRLLDKSWEELQREAKAGSGPRLGRDLRIVSVGAATAVEERAVRVPLVLGDAEGRTATLALTLRLDPLLDGDEDA